MNVVRSAVRVRMLLGGLSRSASATPTVDAGDEAKVDTPVPKEYAMPTQNPMVKGPDAALVVAATPAAGPPSEAVTEPTGHDQGSSEQDPGPAVQSPSQVPVAEEPADPAQPSGEPQAQQEALTQPETVQASPPGHAVPTTA
jgi:hypothetical protein